MIQNSLNYETLLYQNLYGDYWFDYLQERDEEVRRGISKQIEVVELSEIMKERLQFALETEWNLPEAPYDELFSSYLQKLINTIDFYVIAENLLKEYAGKN
jgi:hypothetical protein